MKISYIITFLEGRSNLSGGFQAEIIVTVFPGSGKCYSAVGETHLKSSLWEIADAKITSCSWGCSVRFT